MAYNLPPPWDPGYALPGNVRDEGLERRTLVTRWSPRGTYDAPRVNTGGYVVPQYVIDEGIGQGTHVTQWQPRGTYHGPRVPHWLNERPRVVGERRRRAGGVDVTFSRAPGMGDAPLKAFGDRGATAILNEVTRLPPAQRKAALKRALDGLDPTLHKRAGDIARDLNARGVPPAQAVREGLARALSAGLTAELIRTGERGTRPPAGSLLGLGCYGAGPFRAALGADAPTPGAVIARAPAQPGFTWEDATATARGYWRRLRVGEVGQGPPIVAGAPTVTPATGGGWCVVDGRSEWMTDPAKCKTPLQTGTAIVRDHKVGEEPSKVHEPAQKERKTLDLMGFKIPIDPETGDFRFNVTNPNALSETTRELLRKAWTTGSDNNPLMPAYSGLLWPRPSNTTTTPEKEAAWAAHVRPWLDAVGIADGEPIAFRKIAYIGCSFVFANPVGNKDWCLHARLIIRDGPDVPRGERDDQRMLKGNVVTGPLSLQFTGNPVPEPGVFDRIVGAWGDVNKAVIESISELACNAIASPGAATAATAVGGPVAGVGVAVASKSCAAPPPPPPPPPPSIWPVALLAGGVVAAATLFSKERRK